MEKARRHLGDVLADVAPRLLRVGSVEAALRETVELAVTVVPGAEMAGVSLVDDWEDGPSAATDARVEALDRLQSELGEGPRFDATLREVDFAVVDLREEQCWPHFAPAAARLGLRSLLVYRLFVDPEVYGALSLYSRQVGAFGEEQRQVGWLLAVHASAALFHLRASAHDDERASQLVEAIGSRDEIGQAKGILMERHRLSDEEAFGMLVNLSQRQNRKLRLVAQQILAEHVGWVAGGDATPHGRAG